MDDADAEAEASETAEEPEDTADEAAADGLLQQLEGEADEELASDAEELHVDEDDEDGVDVDAGDAPRRQR